MTVTNDPIIFVDDVLEFARETLQRFERGELRAYAFRVFMKDGSYQDFVGGCTEEDQQRARADMLKRFDCEVET